MNASVLFTSLSPGGNWVLGMSATFASLAAIVGFTRPGYPGFAAIRLTRAALAALYACMYWADLFNVFDAVDRLGVSQVLAPFVWVLVWTVPSLAVPRKEAKIEDRVVEAVAAVMTPVPQETP